MNEFEFQKDPLSPLEISGAISAKVIHDLANMVGGIIGNAEYAADAAGDSPSLKKAIQAITTSANSAGRILGQCLPLQRSITGAAFACDTNELAKRIAAANSYAPEWRVNVPSNLRGQVQAQGRWLIGAVWQIVRETKAVQGEMDFLCGPAVFPVTWRSLGLNQGRPIDLFQINLRYRSEQTLLPPDNSVTAENPGLFAACELLRVSKGQIQCRTKSPGRQEISLLLPLT
ncbi:hypothetical protein [Pedosphaera parvula]|uniref:histidine kinase n=1 Tax=Pedosphaera parvula (strain Ellin514) TaxID=320771 RepID=B9XHF7_PEDPL|nr:hypothetical protein [Pedosphaera parvula]EEF60792.1 hypothetical protein Cflav_PD3650 [Pedosphaera parvula Ellin514]